LDEGYRPPAIGFNSSGPSASHEDAEAGLCDADSIVDVPSRLKGHVQAKQSLAACAALKIIPGEKKHNFVICCMGDE